MHASKLKQLSISMGIGLLCLIIFLAVSSNAISAYLFAENTRGEVIEYSVTRERPVYYNASQHTPERHEVLVEYRVNKQPYWVVVNSHAYSALNIINIGDELLIAYQADSPQTGYVMSFALFNTFASILLPFILMIFVLVTPQWIYNYRRSK
jgi:hypothetical protein